MDFSGKQDLDEVLNNEAYFQFDLEDKRGSSSNFVNQVPFDPGANIPSFTNYQMNPPVSFVNPFQDDIGMQNPGAFVPNNEPQVTQENLLNIPFGNVQRQGSPSNFSDVSSNGINSPFLSPAASPFSVNNDAFDNLSVNNDNDCYDTLSSYVDSGNNGADQKLTIENLQQFHDRLVTTPIIKYEDVEQQAAKTPSLFGSSNKSSPLNTPRRSRANSVEKDKYSDSLLPSVNITTTGGNDNGSLLSPSPSLLQPNYEPRGRLGRLGSRSVGSKSPSRSRSRSKNRDKAISEDREKILELASPNHSNKRQQKHPSIFACDLCDKKFTRPYNLKSHKRTHTDERPFVCLKCGKAFARQHDKKRHEDLHTGEKRFQCRGFLKDGTTPWGCGKKFARIDALGRHFRTEAGKECIRLLFEEAEAEKKESGDFYHQLLQQQQLQRNIPRLSVSPPLVKQENVNELMSSNSNSTNHDLLNGSGHLDMGYSPDGSPIDGKLPDFLFSDWNSQGNEMS